MITVCISALVGLKVSLGMLERSSISFGLALFVGVAMAQSRTRHEPADQTTWFDTAHAHAQYISKINTVICHVIVQHDLTMTILMTFHHYDNHFR